MDEHCQDKEEEVSGTAYNSIGNKKRLKETHFLMNWSMLTIFMRVSKVFVFHMKCDFHKKKKYRIGDKRVRQLMYF